MHRKLAHLLLCFFVATIAAAQAPLSIRGSVRDRTGATVSGAEVRLEDLANTILATSLSDAHGEFSFPTITPGTYRLEVPAYAGFAPRVLPITLTTSITNLRVALQPESVSAEITVTSDSPALSTDAADNKDAVTVSAAEIRKLPVFDQDIVATMTPFLDAGSGSSGGPTIIVDGVEVKAANVAPSAIQEVRINNDPYAAEFVRPGRGRIEIITKPGTPQFHGEANFTFRDAIFNARNFFALTRPPESRRIYEGHISGPVGHGGHTSFIASASRREQNTAAVVNAIGPTGAIIQNVLTPRLDPQYTIRVNHDFSPTHRISLGYVFEQHIRTNNGVGGIVLPEAGYNTNGRLIITPEEVRAELSAFSRIEDLDTKAIAARFFTERTDGLTLKGSAAHLLTAWR